MTDQEQRKADHLAMVAAPLAALYAHHTAVEGSKGELSVAELMARKEDFANIVLDFAESLQKAAEERVSHE